MAPSPLQPCDPNGTDQMFVTEISKSVIASGNYAPHFKCDERLKERLSSLGTKLDCQIATICQTWLDAIVELEEEQEEEEKLCLLQKGKQPKNVEILLAINMK